MSRKTPAAFLRFVPVIAEALASYPSPVRVRFKGKPSGVMQPLRDALKAKDEAADKTLYAHPTIDETRYASLRPHLRVWEHDGNAWLGPKPTDKALATVGATSASTPMEYELVDHAMLADLCKLVAKSALRPMPVFIVKGVQPLARIGLGEAFGVSFIEIEPGSHQIV